MLKKILAALFVCLATMAGVECIYSLSHLNVYRGGVTSEGPVWSWIIYDPVMGWMNMPGYVKPEKFSIDRNGLRVVDRPMPAQRSRLVVCMGDSGTFGIWAARNDSLEFDSFPAYLQDILAAHNDVVVNAGTIGYTSAHLVRQYMSSIRRMKPQVLVIRVGHNDHLPSWDKRLDVQSPRNALLRRLYMEFPSLLTTQTIAHYSFSLNRRVMGEPWSTPEQYEANLRTLIREARRDGVQVFLVDYPLRPLGIPPVLPGDYQKRLMKMGVPSHQAYIDLHEKYMQRMEAVAASTGTPVIRTKHRLENPAELAYSGFDQVHPNRHGMQIVAEEIGKALLGGSGRP